MYLFLLGYENWNSNRKRTLVVSLVYYTKNLDIISCARCCHASRASRQIRCEDASKICDWRRNISFFRHWALRRVPTNVSQASALRQFERSLVMILAMGKSGKTIRNVTYIHWIWIKTKIINLKRKRKSGLPKGDSRHENFSQTTFKMMKIFHSMTPKKMWKSSTYLIFEN